MNLHTRVALIILIAIPVAWTTSFAATIAIPTQALEERPAGDQPYELHHPVLRSKPHPQPLIDMYEGVFSGTERAELWTMPEIQDDPIFPEEPQRPRIWNLQGREYDLRYSHNDERMRGFIAEPAGGESLGTVLIVHQWRGLGDEEKERARMLAKLGYVAFAIDMYGDGVRAENNEEAAELAGKYYADRQLMRGRVQAAIDALRENDKNTETLAAIGYCFGGTVVLECARHGFDLDAVVSFHGGLSFESAPRRGQVNASVLVCNGYDDPLVSIEDRNEFKREMANADADFVFIDYADAVHSFTSKAAGPMEPGKVAAYNETADKRSWAAMRRFFEDTLQ
ncbi:MAG: dienelactone hydrolase family protein [Phycisphaerales bacterium]|nr:dienelactone hydrolase family protein [Phycisphaerales bacterium]